MKAEKTRAAVIGAGHIAKQHLGALKSIDDVEVVGVCDLSPVTAEAIADRFDVPRWFTSHDEMLADTDPHVVHILTPAHTHVALSEACLARGRHVFVEKPLTEVTEDCEALIEEANRRDLWLIEDYNYLFNRGVQRIIDYQASGELGEVRHVDIQISLNLFSPGSRYADPDALHPSALSTLGVFSDFLTHLCYLAHFFIGASDRVTTVTKRLRSGAHVGPDLFQSMLEGESATALIGVTTDIDVDGFFLRVQGTKMRVETNLFEAGLVATSAHGSSSPLTPIKIHLARSRAERSAAWHSLIKKLGGGPGAYEGLWELVRRTYCNLRSGGRPPVSPRQILEVNRMCSEVVTQASAA